MTCVLTLGKNQHRLPAPALVLGQGRPRWNVNALQVDVLVHALQQSPWVATLVQGALFWSTSVSGK